jgi:hypothetical protein
MWRSARARRPTSWNRFIYVSGDPIDRFDPLGAEEACPDGGDDGDDGCNCDDDGDDSCVYDSGVTFYATGSTDDDDEPVVDPEPIPEPADFGHESRERDGFLLLQFDQHAAV